MATLASNFTDFLRNYGPVVRSEFAGAYDQWPSRIGDLFFRTPTNKSIEKVGGATGLGNMSVFVGTLEYENAEALWSKTRAMTRFAEAVAIEPDLIEDNDYPEIMRRVTGLAESARVSQETFAGEVYNEMDQTTFTYDNNSFNSTTPDAKAICATDHPYSKSDSTTQSNKGTSTFADTSLSAALVAMKKFLDPKGRKAMILPDTLVVGPHLEEAVGKLIPAGQYPGNANNDNNPFNPGNPMNLWVRGLRVVSWPYLNGTSESNSTWFLMDSKLMRRSLFWFDRVAPTFNDTADFDTLQAKYSVMARWGVLAADWRFVYGNFPT